MGSFDWLVKELDEVAATPGFHAVWCDPSPLRVRKAVVSVVLPSSYLAFVEEFGFTRLYRDGDDYAIEVFPWPVQHGFGGDCLQIGTSELLPVFVPREEIHAESIMELRLGEPDSTRMEFDEWLAHRAGERRSEFSADEWAGVCAVPAPFSADEWDIVRARRLFDVAVVEVKEDGYLRLHVENRSTRCLPFLSVGIRTVNFDGVIWLPVAHIPPGAASIVEHTAYAAVVNGRSREIYSLPDPVPSQRTRYWEFRQVP